jgi:hypothetical protein
VENIYAWEDLSFAGLTPTVALGGLVQPGTNFPVPKGGAVWIQLFIGLNIPASSFSDSIGYNILSADPTLVGSGDYPPAVSSGQLMIEVGTTTGDAYSNMLWHGGFTAPQAKQMDAKIDDGLPNTGIFSAMNPQAPGSATPCLSGIAYSSSAATGCGLYFLLRP